jgi:hypothetical protein
MNFANEASKLLTNKYFLYFIVFVSAANVLGYLVSNRVNTVIFFSLIAFLASRFSKNMVVILLAALIATNLLMVNKGTREGLENATLMEGESKDGEPVPTSDKPDPVVPVDPAATAAAAIGSAPTSGASAKTTDPVKPDEKEKPKVEKFGNKNASKLSGAAPVNTDGGSRIDYASTLEGAYDNLDKILGSDGINKLTGDTQKLMDQQQKLFNSMQSMAPMIENAKGMMAGFNPEDLKGLAGIASSLTGSGAAPKPVVESFGKMPHLLKKHKK